VLLAAGFLYSLMQTLVLPALPALGASLDSSPEATAWVLTTFLLSAAVSIPLVGKLGDRYGHRRVLMAVLVAFAAGSALCAMADELSLLLVGRLVQGIGGGLFPLAFGIARAALPPATVPSAVSALSAVIGVGAGVGLPLSGVIVDQVDPAWLFWPGLIALPLVFATLRWVPPSPPGPPDAVDWIGAALLAGGLTGLLLGATRGAAWGWLSPATIGSAAGGVLLLVGWVWVERRRTAPLVSLQLLGRRPVWAADLCAFLIGLALFAGFLAIPQFAQVPDHSGFGFGFSATAAGLLLLPNAVCQVLASNWSARIGARFGFRVSLLAGNVLIAVAFGALSLVHDHPWHLAAGGAVLGLGVGLSFAALANVTVDAVGPAEVGIATGLNTVARTIGAAFGSAVAATAIAVCASPEGPTRVGFVVAFLIAAVISVLAIAAALLVPRGSQTAPSDTASSVVEGRPRPIASCRS
jgi:EmrB/QacA subfamily drug resistance transporter